MKNNENSKRMLTKFLKKQRKKKYEKEITVKTFIQHLLFCIFVSGFFTWFILLDFSIPFSEAPKMYIGVYLIQIIGYSAPAMMDYISENNYLTEKELIQFKNKLKNIEIIQTDLGEHKNYLFFTNFEKHTQNMKKVKINIIKKYLNLIEQKSKAVLNED